MATTRNPLSRQLEVYEESWKVDHEEMKRTLWRFEDNLAVGLALFKAVHDRYWSWCERVRTGTVDYTVPDEGEFKAQFEWWFRPCEAVMNRLEELEDAYGVGAVEGGREFRRCCQEARQILDSWVAPVARPEEAAHDAKLRGAAAHTKQAMTHDEMAKELDRVSRPTTIKSVPLQHKPDDSHVF